MVEWFVILTPRIWPVVVWTLLAMTLMSLKLLFQKVVKVVVARHLQAVVVYAGDVCLSSPPLDATSLEQCPPQYADPKAHREVFGFQFSGSHALVPLL
jgi:hypothetical protein